MVGQENRQIHRLPAELPGVIWYFGMIFHSEEQTEQVEEYKRTLYIM